MKMFKTLGLIAATISTISFTQKIFNVGLLPTLNDFINYYREISYAVYGVPFKYIGISVPVELRDFWSISFVCAGAYISSENIENTRAFRRYNLDTLSLKLKIAIFFFFGFTGISLFIPLSALSISTYNGENDITLEALKNTLILFSITVLFFIFNAFAPSV